MAEGSKAPAFVGLIRVEAGVEKQRGSARPAAGPCGRDLGRAAMWGGLPRNVFAVGRLLGPLTAFCLSEAGGDGPRGSLLTSVRA